MHGHMDVKFSVLSFIYICVAVCMFSALLYIIIIIIIIYYYLLFSNYPPYDF